jgi:hypothetical protein
MLNHLDKLSPEAVKVLEPFARKLLELDRENICSLAVYGSATGVNFVPGKSNVNLAAVVGELMLKQLKTYRELIAKRRKQEVVPLFLTKEHIRSSLDVFPMELLEIKDNHVTIFGEEIFDSLKIELKYLRLQCEREIKSRLIRLRQSYPEVGSKARELNGFLEQSFNSVLPIMRSVLYLGDREIAPGISRGEVISQLSAQFDIDGVTFRNVLELKTLKKPPDLPELEALFDRYLQNLQKLAHVVDQIKC